MSLTCADCGEPIEKTAIVEVVEAKVCGGTTHVPTYHCLPCWRKAEHVTATDGASDSRTITHAEVEGGA